VEGIWGYPGPGASQASRLSTIKSTNSSTTNAQRRARRRLSLTPALANRVSQSGHLSWPATEMPQYGQWLSILPPGTIWSAVSCRGYNLPIGPDGRKSARWAPKPAGSYRPDIIVVPDSRDRIKR
jgi:hypothetical protein